jgi:phenylacetate-CoA ligase
MIRDQYAETLPREELEALQLRRLKNVVERVYHLVPFYRRRLDEAGYKPGDLQTLADMEHLPFTTKQDLRDNYPFGMFAVPMEQVVRLHASSGTTGKPTPVGYTARDLETWAELMARVLAAGGVHRRRHRARGLRLWPLHRRPGLPLRRGAAGRRGHPGFRRPDPAPDHAHPGLRPQCHLLHPSFALYLAEVGREMGVDFKETKLRVGVFGAEPWSEAMRARRSKSPAHLDALDIYGLSEIMGPGVAMECLEAKKGLHIFEDHFLPEIIDPVTGEVLPPGETGELVFTTLTKEAFPLIRYRTRDLTDLDYTPCRCGRTMARMSRVKGRSDDMLIIRGVNVFPSQIESVLMDVPGGGPPLPAHRGPGRAPGHPGSGGGSG